MSTVRWDDFYRIPRRRRNYIAVVNHTTVTASVNAGNPVATLFQAGEIDHPSTSCVQFWPDKRGRQAIKESSFQLMGMSEQHGRVLLTVARKMGSFQAAFERLMPGRTLKNLGSMGVEARRRELLLAAARRAGIDTERLLAENATITNQEIRKLIGQPTRAVQFVEMDPDVVKEALSDDLAGGEVIEERGAGKDLSFSEYLAAQKVGEIPQLADTLPKPQRKSKPAPTPEVIELRKALAARGTAWKPEWTKDRLEIELAAANERKLSPEAAVASDLPDDGPEAA